MKLRLLYLTRPRYGRGGLEKTENSFREPELATHVRTRYTGTADLEATASSSPPLSDAIKLLLARARSLPPSFHLQGNYICFSQLPLRPRFFPPEEAVSGKFSRTLEMGGNFFCRLLLSSLATVQRRFLILRDCAFSPPPPPPSNFTISSHKVQSPISLCTFPVSCACDKSTTSPPPPSTLSPISPALWVSRHFFVR